MPIDDKEANRERFEEYAQTMSDCIAGVYQMGIEAGAASRNPEIECLKSQIEFLDAELKKRDNHIEDKRGMVDGISSVESKPVALYGYARAICFDREI